ncbi:hypothetical protein F5X98DRAFT_371527 [Xylaria grammica]|nr:hypothetical protein F5X98DRAFT_371527 [Xylaria grammica]
MPETDIWTDKATLIRRLYVRERKTLKQVKAILETEHEFPVHPLSTYESKIRDKLRLRKKLKRAEWPVVYHHFQSRAGKETGVYLNNVRIPWEKAWKEIRRSGGRSIRGGPPDPLPGDVVVRTPSPVIQPISPDFLGQDRQPSVFYPPVQNSVIFQNQSSSVGLQPHPYISTAPMRATYWSPHGLSLVQYMSHQGGEGDAVAGMHNFEVSFYHDFLQTTPWNQFNKTLLAIIGDIVHLSDKSNLTNRGLFDQSIGADFTWFMSDSLSHRGILSAPTSLPSLDSGSTAPSVDFSTYHFIRRFLTLLSNKIDIPDTPDTTREISELFDILFRRLPIGILLKLFESDVPTMRAAWEASVSLAWSSDQKDAFSLLMKAGLQNPDWILSDGYTYLSLTVSMGCIDIVRDLLRIGVRADDECRETECPEKSLAPAILEAAIAGDYGCVQKLIQGCDVNRVIHRWGKDGRASNFGIFVSAIGNRVFYHSQKQPPNTKIKIYELYDMRVDLNEGIYGSVLDTFLENGADVDLPWSGNPHTIISKLHDANDIPIEWKLSVLERCFYWNFELYDRLRPYSRKEGIELTRPGVCLSAKRGKQTLQDYLDSRPIQHPADRKMLLELILTEQFFRGNGQPIDVEVILGLVDLGVDVKAPYTCPDYPMMSNKNGSLFLYSMLADSRHYGYTEGVSAFVGLAVSRGAIIDFNVVEAAVSRVGLGFLLEIAKHGVDIKAQGGLALCRAAYWNNFEAVSWLLQAGVELNTDICVWDWPTPRSIIAIASGHFPLRPGLRITSRITFITPSSVTIEMLGYLIRCGAKLRTSSRDRSSFHLLKGILDKDVVDRLLLSKMKYFLVIVAVPEDLFNTKETLMEWCFVICNVSPRVEMGLGANIEERIAIYELLLRLGCPVLRESGLAPYIFCGGRLEVINEVLDAGADVNACSITASLNGFRAYPLQAAAMRGDLGLVIHLLQRGAIINQPAIGYRGRTALQGSCEWTALSKEERKRKIDLIKFLISQGADVNASGAERRGMTALRIATLYGDMEVALLLLEHGATINAPPAGRDGYCALDAAALEGRLDMVKLLLNTGAHSRYRGQTGYEGAIRLATENGNFAVVEVIREHIRLFGNCVIVDLGGD